MIVKKKITNLKELNAEINRLKGERITYRAMLKEDIHLLKEALNPRALIKDALKETVNLPPQKGKWLSDGITTIAGVLLDRVLLKKMNFKQAMASTVKDVAVPALISRIKDIFSRKKHQPA